MNTYRCVVFASLSLFTIACSMSPSNDRAVQLHSHTPASEAADRTRTTIQSYFAKLKDGGDWQSVLAEDVTFTSYTSPAKQLTGRAEYLQATKGFYGSIRSFELKDLMIEGEKACAFTEYWLQPPGQAAFVTSVAEVFRVRQGRIVSFGIYFDTAPFPK